MQAIFRPDIISCQYNKLLCPSSENKKLRFSKAYVSLPISGGETLQREFELELRLGAISVGVNVVRIELLMNCPRRNSQGLRHFADVALKTGKCLF